MMPWINSEMRWYVFLLVFTKTFQHFFRSSIKLVARTFRLFFIYVVGLFHQYGVLHKLRNRFVKERQDETELKI